MMKIERNSNQLFLVSFIGGGSMSEVKNMKE